MSLKFFAGALLILSAGLEGASYRSQTPELVRKAEILVQLRAQQLLEGDLAAELEAALKRKAKVKLLVAESSPVSDRLKAQGALLRYSTLGLSETAQVLVDAKLALAEGSALETEAWKASLRAVKFEKAWQKASSNEARQWEKEFKALPDPRGPEDLAPKLKTRRRKA